MSHMYNEIKGTQDSLAGINPESEVSPKVSGGSRNKGGLESHASGLGLPVTLKTVLNGKVNSCWRRPLDYANTVTKLEY